MVGESNKLALAGKTTEIADAIRIKPSKIRAILERLKKQHRVEQRGSMDLSCITDYEFAARERG